MRGLRPSTTAPRAPMRVGDHRASALRRRRNPRARHAGPSDPGRAARALESSRGAARLGGARARRRGARHEAPRPDLADPAHGRRGRRDRARAAGLRPAPAAAAEQLSVGAAAADAVALVVRVLPTHDVELRTSGDATTVARPGEIRRQLVELLLDALDAPAAAPSSSWSSATASSPPRAAASCGSRRGSARPAGRRAARPRPRRRPTRRRSRPRPACPGSALAAGR